MSDPISAPVAGQGAPAPAQGQATEAPYFSFRYDDGKEEVYQTPEELAKAWKDSHLRRQDYTKKTQEIARYRESLTAKEKEFAEKEKTLAEKEAQAKKLDNFLRTRPDVYRELMTRMQQPPSADVAVERATQYADEKYSTLEQQIKEVQEWKKAQEEDRELQSVFGKMKEQYPDFDENIIRDSLSGLTERGIEGLAEALYHAHRGKNSPIETEKKVLENIKNKQAARVMPGGPSAPSPRTAPASLEEALENAQADVRHRGG